MDALPGWYPDPQSPGMRRWWDGQQWTAQTSMAPPPAYVPPPTNHVLHLLVTVLTGGAWAPAWLLIAWLNSRERTRVMAEERGWRR